MRKIIAMLVLALLICSCGNRNADQTSKSKKKDNTEQSNKDRFPEKFTGAYFIQKAQSVIADVPEPKVVQSVGVVDGNTATVKINYLGADHVMVFKFVDEDWVLYTLDGVEQSKE